MFWDGTRWIDERAGARPPAPSTPKRGPLRNWLAALVITTLAASLAVPVVLAGHGATSLSVSGTALSSARLKVSGLSAVNARRAASLAGAVPTGALAPLASTAVTITTASPMPPATPAPTPSLVAVYPPLTPRPVVTPAPTLPLPGSTRAPPAGSTPVLTASPSPTLTAAPTPVAMSTAVATGLSRALGVYVHGSAWNFALLDAYALQAGGMPTFATTYHEWVSTNGDDGEKFPTYPAGYAPQISMLNAFANLGIVPILTWQPFADWNAGGPQPGLALSTILSGDHDATIQVWVEAARAYGKPVYIRFAHEMNGDWYPWGQGVNGNTPAQYVAAWRHVVDLFRAGGATNVRWVWSPNEIKVDKYYPAGQYPLTGLYPGDDYVDLIGLDGYNWGTSGVGSAGWRSFTQIFGATYDQVRALAPSKPVYVAETASTELGGDKAAWITSAFLTEIPSHFPALKGVVWFDTGGAMRLANPAQNADWGIDSSSSALAAFRNVAASSGWRGTLH